MNQNFSPQQKPEQVPTEPRFQKRLSGEDVALLFHKRKSVEWMLKNRTDMASQKLYSQALASIMAEMDSGGITEDRYRDHLLEVPETEEDYQKLH